MYCTTDALGWSLSLATRHRLRYLREMFPYPENASVLCYKPAPEPPYNSYKS